MKFFVDERLPIIFLKPGEVSISDKPVIVTTVLGSCVAVAMFDRSKKIGAMCHCMLPKHRKIHNDYLSQSRFKYVDYSIPWMIEKLSRWEVARKDIEVKLFGGSDMLTAKGQNMRRPTIGAENIEMALAIIEGEGLNIVCSNVGGKMGRKLLFYTHTGDVFLRRVRKLSVV